MLVLYKSIIFRYVPRKKLFHYLIILIYPIILTSEKGLYEY